MKCFIDLKKSRNRVNSGQPVSVTAQHGLRDTCATKVITKVSSLHILFRKWTFLKLLVCSQKNRRSSLTVDKFAFWCELLIVQYFRSK